MPVDQSVLQRLKKQGEKYREDLARKKEQGEQGEEVDSPEISNSEQIALDVKLRKIYNDILKGFSSGFVFGEEVYFAHFSNFDQCLMDEAYNKYMLEAKEHNIPTNKERLKFLEKENLWLPEDEKNLENKRQYLAGIGKTKRKLIKQSDIDSLEKQSKVVEKEYIEITNEKISLLDVTCETYAEKKVNEYYILICLKKDRGLKEQYFSNEDFLYVDEEELNEIKRVYNESLNEINSDNIRRISVAPFFQNYFYLCNDNIGSFFGKPISALTYYQCELLNNGKYFKSLLGELNNLSSEAKRNPDKIEEYYEAKRKETERQSKGDGKRKPTSSSQDASRRPVKGSRNRSNPKKDIYQGKVYSSVVGASKEDLQKIATGDEEQNATPFDYLKKTGQTSMNMMDFVKAEGLNIVESKKKKKEPPKTSTDAAQV